MIEFIDVDRIFPHPDNPRRDLGDLTELADSIKTNGILQNLTVVPEKKGYCTTCAIFNGAAGKCQDDHDLVERPPCKHWKPKGNYTVVIGHRRLAAAKLAGHERVPCAVVEMDKKTQVATMLLENIQRNDLTVYEQAQGFQMMLNLGETVSDISEKTGFSETTVRRRTKLLELDQEEFKKSTERGATLMDYAKLEKIKDINLRNEVLAKIGTNNFGWALRNAIDEEKSKKKMEPVIEKLESFATKVESKTADLKFIRAYHDTVENLIVEIPEDVDEVSYYYEILKYGSVYLYKKKTEAEIENEANASEREAESAAKRQELERISEKAYQLRREFICNVSNATAKKNIEHIIGHLVETLIHNYISISPENIAELLNIEIPEDEELKFDDIADSLFQQPEKHLLIVVYLALNGVRESYFRWDGAYCRNRGLDQAYDLLETLGYEISDVELALKNGTHELFVKGENND